MTLGLSAAGALVPAARADALPSNCLQSGTNVTCTFSFTGADQTFMVPAAVTALTVTAVGAAGGAGDNAPGTGGASGGRGASVTDTAVPVTPDQVLTVVVGGVGQTGGATKGGAGGAPGGGGAGGDFPVANRTADGDGGGGGGYSGLLASSGSPLVIAAGGGGGGGFDGGAGGAGDTGAGGAAGANGDQGGGGGGGTATAGGAGGADQSTPANLCAVATGPGSAGGSLSGGQGGVSNGAFNSSGGGGGGGYFGGGGGGGGCVTGGGGGGGSSFGITGLTSEANTSRPASVTISYADSDLALTGVPGNITTDATGPAGAVVTYTPPTATDEDSPSDATVACRPAPGSTFAIGTTAVTCTATDADDANSPVTAAFTVTVKGAAAQLADLLSAVGQDRALANTVQIAQRALAAGNTRQACLALSTFIIEVQTAIPPIPSGTAARLVADASRIRTVLAC